MLSSLSAQLKPGIPGRIDARFLSAYMQTKGTWRGQEVGLTA